VEYLIARDAKESGGQAAGVLQDAQWNTYDEALHGVTSFISGYYLAALRAGEEWARRMGDAPTADYYHAIFVSGQRKLVELCWNGEYFQQHFPAYLQHKGEVGPGCMSDQLIGQWWAHQLGLGYILPKAQVASAMHAIFKYNWKSDLTGWKHSPRAFAGAHDKGLLICTWPKGGRPDHVMLYSDEVWTGIEYQVAAHMIYEGMIEQGYSIVKGARDRYDGIPRPPIGRNPWCEIECGGHYTRAMSSWSLLLALSGFEYDGPRGTLRFTPRYKPDEFKCFFTASEGWGSLAQKSIGPSRQVEITIKSGKLRVNSLELTALANENVGKAAATLAGKVLPIVCSTTNGQCRITFDGNAITVNEGQTLVVNLT
jgi:non-lysosomal glucosylceramidase